MWRQWAHWATGYGLRAGVCVWHSTSGMWSAKRSSPHGQTDEVVSSPSRRPIYSSIVLHYATMGNSSRVWSFSWHGRCTLACPTIAIATPVLVVAIAGLVFHACVRPPVRDCWRRHAPIRASRRTTRCMLRRPPWLSGMATASGAPARSSGPTCISTVAGLWSGMLAEGHCRKKVQPSATIKNIYIVASLALPTASARKPRTRLTLWSSSRSSAAGARRSTLAKAVYSPKMSIWVICTAPPPGAGLDSLPTELRLDSAPTLMCPGIAGPRFITGDDLALQMARVGPTGAAAHVMYHVPSDDEDLLRVIPDLTVALPDFATKAPAHRPPRSSNQDLRNIRGIVEDGFSFAPIGRRGRSRGRGSGVARGVWGRSRQRQPAADGADADVALGSVPPLMAPIEDLVRR